MSSGKNWSIEDYEKLKEAIKMGVDEKEIMSYAQINLPDRSLLAIKSKMNRLASQERVTGDAMALKSKLEYNSLLKERNNQEPISIPDNIIITPLPAPAPEKVWTPEDEKEFTEALKKNSSEGPLRWLNKRTITIKGIYLEDAVKKEGVFVITGNFDIEEL